MIEKIGPTMYNGGSIYKIGTGGGGTDPNIIYKTDFTNFDAATGVDIPIVGSNVTWSGLQNTILSSNKYTLSSKNYLQVNSLQNNASTSPQTNIPVPTDTSDFELSLKCSFTSDGSSGHFSTMHLLQLFGFGYRYNVNATIMSLTIPDSYARTIVDRCTQTSTSGGTANYRFDYVDFRDMNEVKFVYENGDLHFIVNDVERMYVTYDVTGNDYFLAISPRYKLKILIGDLTYKKL